MAEPVSTILGVKLSIAQGAVAGSTIAFILGTGTWRQRTLHAIGGALFAVYGTEGAVEMLGRSITVTDATQRLGGLVFGICGILIAQGLTHGATRFRERSDDIVDRVIERRVVATRETTRRRRPRGAVPPVDTDVAAPEATP